jgi:threonine synthase
MLILEALRRSEGTAVAVADSTILEVQREVAGLEGCFVCPEGAAALAAVGSLRSSGWLGPDQTVVVLNTGSGLKYPDLVSTEAAIQPPP